MNGQLNSGTVLTSKSNVCYTVVSLLGSGGQGEVYEVEANGTHKALKWYFPKSAQPQQMEILKRLVEMGSPDAAFLWPEDLILSPDGKTFGYIMPLRPKQYKGLAALLKARITLSFYVRCRIAFNLAKAYEKLHALGNCYRDINYGNLFFDPDTGDILICDNDNVAPKDMPGLVKGTYGFMAPEIIRGEAKPSRYTDQYSLAVLQFHIFMIAHPLHGKLEASIKCWDIPAQNLIYGTHPVFIFDPNDDSNRPVKGIHDNALIYWNLYPQELKDLFVESFTIGLMSPHRRVTENRWLNVTANMMSSICPCPRCGAEVIYDESKARNNQAHICWDCHNTVKMPCTLEIGRHRVLLLKGAKIRAHQVLGNYDMDTVVGSVVQNPTKSSVMGIRNESTDNWNYVKPDGSQAVIVPGRSASIAQNVKIDFGYKIGEFK